MNSTISAVKEMLERNIDYLNTEDQDRIESVIKALCDIEFKYQDKIRSLKKELTVQTKQCEILYQRWDDADTELSRLK